jgi:chromosome segregation ATPase
LYERLARDQIQKKKKNYFLLHLDKMEEVLKKLLINMENIQVKMGNIDVKIDKIEVKMDYINVKMEKLENNIQEVQQDIIKIKAGEPKATSSKCLFLFINLNVNKFNFFLARLSSGSNSSTKSINSDS